MKREELESLLFDNLKEGQKSAVRSQKRRVLVVAGAGSGKTEVMARRIAWWIGVEKVPKDNLIAFTFTERAAEEMKFRIRGWVGKLTPPGEDVILGNMYVGTIHGFCISKLREFWPDNYHNYDILDEGARAALILRGFHSLLGLVPLQNELNLSQYATMESFALAYDQLHEHNCFDVELPSEDPPVHLGDEEHEWCKKARLLTDVGNTEACKIFGRSAARYYAYLHCRRFLDFSTSQTEFIRQLKKDRSIQKKIKESDIHLVVDEVQDINPVQLELMNLLTGDSGTLTAVGDHRQSIYGFRGAKVEIIARLWENFKQAPDSEVIDLQDNFRSTPRVIGLANTWADTISRLRTMKTPPMEHGNKKRKDHHSSHVALIDFETREEEASWIAKAIRVLVPSDKTGAEHDKKDGSYRGLSLSDIAVLVRSSTSVRTYMQALEDAGIPSIVRAGPDLFSQPEVLLLVGSLGMSAGITEFRGSSYNPKSMPNRIHDVLGCNPEPKEVVNYAAKLLRRSGLSFDRASEDRLVFAAEAIRRRVLENYSFTKGAVARLRTPKLRDLLTSTNPLRRVFPQQLYHFLLTEANVEVWDTVEGRGQTALFHLGALSGLIIGIETPGWTSVHDYPWQIIGLCQYGAEEGRVEEQPLMVRPDAITLSTIHSVKGLEFAAVFLADVNSRRFPSGYAKRKANLPLSGKIVKEIDVEGLSDNDNYDGERRLMYVALTRSERFLFITHSGASDSLFIKELRPLVDKNGGIITDDSERILSGLRYLPKEYRRDFQLSTSFSDLRYFLECPHDFYLRKVLGFSPTIDQAFGYGRGVHNLLRAVHSNPKKWAELAKDQGKLDLELRRLIVRGLFYLRYTTGDPAENMHKKGIEVVSDYIRTYALELEKLTFEPEKKFETLMEYEDVEGGALVSGAIDVIRQDDPPKVTLIDFKSGDPDSDKHQKMDETEMKLQVAVYAVAAKKELEYQPECGLVRYLGAKDKEDKELEVPLNGTVIGEAQKMVSETAAKIRDRCFSAGHVKKDIGSLRCPGCDFLGFCGMPGAVSYKKINPGKWGF